MLPGGRAVRGHFSTEEEASILKALATESTLPGCPRCGKQLIASAPPGGRCSRHDSWALECAECLQCVVVEDDFGIPDRPMTDA